MGDDWGGLCCDADWEGRGLRNIGRGMWVGYGSFMIVSGEIL